MAFQLFEHGSSVCCLSDVCRAFKLLEHGSSVWSILGDVNRASKLCEHGSSGEKKCDGWHRKSLLSVKGNLRKTGVGSSGYVGTTHGARAKTLRRTGRKVLENFVFGGGAEKKRGQFLNFPP